MSRNVNLVNGQTDRLASPYFLFIFVYTSALSESAVFVRSSSFFLVILELVLESEDLVQEGTGIVRVQLSLNENSN
jgi:hypothetical protein